MQSKQDILLKRLERAVGCSHKKSQKYHQTYSQKRQIQNYGIKINTNNYNLDSSKIDLKMDIHQHSNKKYFQPQQLREQLNKNSIQNNIYFVNKQKENLIQSRDWNSYKANKNSSNYKEKQFKSQKYNEQFCINSKINNNFSQLRQNNQFKNQYNILRRKYLQQSQFQSQKHQNQFIHAKRPSFHQYKNTSEIYPFQKNKFNYQPQQKLYQIPQQQSLRRSRVFSYQIQQPNQQSKKFNYYKKNQNQSQKSHNKNQLYQLSNQKQTKSRQQKIFQQKNIIRNSKSFAKQKQNQIQKQLKTNEDKQNLRVPPIGTICKSFQVKQKNLSVNKMRKNIDTHVSLNINAEKSIEQIEKNWKKDTLIKMQKIKQLNSNINSKLSEIFENYSLNAFG